MKKIYKILAVIWIILIWVFLDIHFSKNNNLNIQKNSKVFATKIPKTSHVCIKNLNDLKVFVYMFHYIIPDKDVDINNKIEYWNSLDPDFFDKIMQKLKLNIDNGKIFVGNLSDLEDFSNNFCFPNKNIVILTADDWWDDSYNFLFPIAKKYGIKFNLWIISNKVSKISTEISNFANESEIKTMVNSWLISILSHSYSHIDLRNKTDIVLDKELCESKKDLENLFNVKLNTFLYPSWKYDENTLKMIKNCSYKYAFTTKYWVITQQDLSQRPFELPRIRINRSTNIDKTFDF